MPNKIHPLDESAIRQIAAGEVVERPASVVKELLENSIDAESHSITLEIKEGGKEMIRISDDGCGMTADDALLSLERHTTSKICSANDLQSLTTFGFRGEALPSIASVSKMTLTTRSADESSGITLSLEGGKLISKKECGRSVGTTVEVKKLFFNTPARLKFLKSDLSEKNKILRTFEETSIAHPQISFQACYDNHKAKEFPARKQISERICDLWGDNFTEETLVPIDFVHPQIRIEGWISKPQSHQASKTYQIFYLNKRPIVSRLLSHALYESFRDCLPVGRHPVTVVFLFLDPSQVDVNVHPSKREVRFRNESQVYETLIREMRLKRSQQSSPPKVFSMPNGSTFSSETESPRSSSSPSFPFCGEKKLQHETTIENGKEQTIIFPNRSHAIPSNTPTSLPTEKFKVQETFAPERRILTQFHSLYIIAEQGENLLIVDQHAAAERILYEKFRNELLSEKGVATQPLLIPFMWNVTFSQAELLKHHIPTLQKLGFILETFGEKTFRITEAPAVIPEAHLKNILDNILSCLEDDKQPALTAEEKIMHSACRAAVKANDHLSHKELSQLLDDLSRCSNPHTCPHGRPTTLVIARQELDKKFGRT